jgi:hypothetical protein
MYNKFRAVSSIQVILELCFPVLIMGLQSFQNGKESQWKSLWKPAAVSLGVIIVLFVSKGIFDFSGPNDGYFTKLWS